MNTENKRVNLLELAQVLAVNPSWLGAILREAGLVIQVDGTVATEDFISILYKVAPTHKKETRALLDVTRDHVCSVFNTFNLTLIRPIDGNLWRVIRPDNKAATLKILVSTAVKEQTGQVGYSLALPESPCRWILFALTPWQRYALKNVEELQKSKRSGRKNQSTIFVTFSPGIFRWDLDNRIDDFLADPLAWA
jgi:hypothetical protein